MTFPDFGRIYVHNYIIEIYINSLENKQQMLACDMQEGAEPVMLGKPTAWGLR